MNSTHPSQQHMGDAPLNMHTQGVWNNTLKNINATHDGELRTQTRVCVWVYEVSRTTY